MEEENAPSASDEINIREAQFLASQQARLDKLRINHSQQNDGDFTNNNGGNVQQQRKDFWIILKKISLDLESKLNILMGDDESRSSTCSITSADNRNTVENSLGHENENNPNENKDIRQKQFLYVTTQQRNEALEKLQNIQIIIRCLAHYTMHSNKFTPEEATYLPQQIANFSMPELPTADLRLLNLELQKLKEKSLEAQSIIIPKEKFRFKRYRQALLERKDLGINGVVFDDNGDGNLVDKEVLSVPNSQDDEIESTSAHKFDGITMTDKKNCFLKVHHNGQVTEHNSKEEVDDSIGKKYDSVLSDTKAFLIRDIDSCYIMVEGLLSSLHIINVQNTNINISTPISGPVHVTNCTNSKIKISFCRQLRIHDCNNVSFIIHVTSGPIIEGCKEMKFYQHDYKFGGENNYVNEQNLYWDVKDFHWLKLMKSPNFTVFSEEERIQHFLPTEHNAKQKEIIGKSAQYPTNDEDGESSDEDEL